MSETKPPVLQRVNSSGVVKIDLSKWVVYVAVLTPLAALVAWSTQFTSLPKQMDKVEARLTAIESGDRDRGEAIAAMSANMTWLVRQEEARQARVPTNPFSRTNAQPTPSH